MLAIFALLTALAMACNPGPNPDSQKGSNSAENEGITEVPLPDELPDEFKTPAPVPSPVPAQPAASPKPAAQDLSPWLEANIYYGVQESGVLFDERTTLEIKKLKVRPETRDITPLAKAEKLTILSLSDSLVTDVAPLKKLRHLELLMISNSRVTDLSELDRIHENALIVLYRKDTSALNGREFKNIHLIDVDSSCELERQQAFEAGAFGFKKLQHLRLYNEVPILKEAGRPERGIRGRAACEGTREMQ